MKDLPSDFRPDPELGAALRSALEPKDDHAAFVARVMARYDQARDRATIPTLDVLASWFRPGIAAAAAALIACFLIRRAALTAPPPSSAAAPAPPRDRFPVGAGPAALRFHQGPHARGDRRAAHSRAAHASPATDRPG